MGNLINHAKLELEMAGLFDKDSDYNGALGGAVIELVEVFSKQGHSGMSASLVTNLFNKVARFEPIKPITCEDKEWVEVGEDVFQNKRCGAVFKKGKEGKPYYLDAIVWQSQDSGNFTGIVEGIWSRQYIRLPFNLKTFYIDVISKRFKDGWEHTIKDKNQLEKVFEYYEKYKEEETT